MVQSSPQGYRGRVVSAVQGRGEVRAGQSVQGRAGKSVLGRAGSQCRAGHCRAVFGRTASETASEIASVKDP